MNAPPGRARQTVGMVPLPEELTTTLIVNGHPLVRMSCSPHDLTDLAFGWLYSQQIIDSLADVEKSAIGEACPQMKVWLRDAALGRALKFAPVHGSSCTGGTMNQALFERPRPLSREYPLDAGMLKTAMRSMLDRERLYKQHGGIHCAMLAPADSCEPAVVREDLGRSNAIDKVVGWALANALDLPRHILFVTGRITSEMVLKAHRAGIATVVSLTTLSSQAYEIARETGQTVVAHVLKPRPILVNF